MPQHGPSFTSLLTTLSAIGADSASWTIFYQVSTIPARYAAEELGFIADFLQRSVGADLSSATERTERQL